MKRIFRISLLTATCGFCAIQSVAAIDTEHNQRIIDSFVEHVESLEQITDEQTTNIKNSVDEPTDDAITDALLLIYPSYAAAIDYSDTDDVANGIQQLAPLADSEDLFLAADASFYLARMLMNNEQFEQAIPRLERLTHELASHSTHLGDIQYYTGVAQAGMLKNEEAIRSFMEFLQFNPDAAERLRVSAWRQVQQLQAIQAGQLEDIHQHMDFSRRRLELIETDEITQKKQDEIVKMLGKLIKEQEKKELNSSAKNSNTKKQAQNKPSAPKPSEGSNPGKSQQGGSSSNPNGQVVKKSYDDSPASPWSRLRDRSRDPANNAIQEKLPAHYRDLVEKYYEAANGENQK